MANCTIWLFNMLQNRVWIKQYAYSNGFKSQRTPLTGYFSIQNLWHMGTMGEHSAFEHGCELCLTCLSYTCTLPSMDGCRPPFYPLWCHFTSWEENVGNKAAREGFWSDWPGVMKNTQAWRGTGVTAAEAIGSHTGSLISFWRGQMLPCPACGLH